MASYDPHNIDETGKMKITPLFFDIPLKGELEDTNSTAAVAVLAKKEINPTSVNVKTIIGRRYLNTNENVHLLIGVLDHTRHDPNSTLNPKS